MFDTDKKLLEEVKSLRGEIVALENSQDLVLSELYRLRKVVGGVVQKEEPTIPLETVESILEVSLEDLFYFCSDHKYPEDVSTLVDKGLLEKEVKRHITYIHETVKGLKVYDEVLYIDKSEVLLKDRFTPKEVRNLIMLIGE